MSKITIKGKLRVTQNGVELSSHTTERDALESAINRPSGTYLIKQPDIEVVVTGATVAQPNEAPPAPPAAPAPPAPVPTPTAPAATVASEIVQQPYNPGTPVIGNWHTDSAYARFRFLDRWVGDQVSVRIHNPSGAPLVAGLHTLLIEGAEAASIMPAAGVAEASIPLAIAGMSEGWKRLDLRTPAGDSPTWFVYRVVGDQATQQQAMPVVEGTYEIVQHHDATVARTWVPARYTPTPKPLARRERPNPVRAGTTRRSLNCQQLVPFRFGDTYRPVLSRDGTLSTFDKQSYDWSGLVGALPYSPLLDGPRGVGTLAYVTHVSLGTAVVNGVARHGVYFTDPWRFGKRSEDGTITTLCGYRHRVAPPQWQDVDASSVELVGDWSAIPVERRGFHELWGQAWDSRTLAIDPTAPPVDNESPHVVGPVAFLADSQRGRICKVQFNAADRSPPRVTEFITGLNDPWDCVERPGFLYVSERGAHRILELDATTGAVLRVVVQGQPLGAVNSSRFSTLFVSLEQARAADVVLPEGLDIWGDWLYFASKVQRVVRRVNVVTGVIEHVRNIMVDDNSIFAKISVCKDGTFGDAGTVAICGWSNSQYGYPQTYLPDGTLWPWYEGSQTPGQWGSQQRDSGGGFNYATACALGQGRVVTCGANEGMFSIDLAQPGDVAPNDAVARGELEYRDRALHLRHGAGGFGFYGLPLPWGTSADIDAYLAHMGHVR